MEKILLKNYRQLGLFDLLNPPLTPIQAVDAVALNEQLQDLLAEAHKHVIVDLSNVEFLYSDALSALSKNLELFRKEQGHLGILAQEADVLSAIQKTGLEKFLLVFKEESELMKYAFRTESPVNEAVKTEPKAITNVQTKPKMSDNTGSTEAKEVHSAAKVEQAELGFGKAKKKKKSRATKSLSKGQFLLRLLSIPLGMILILLSGLAFFKPELFQNLIHAIFPGLF